MRAQLATQSAELRERSSERVSEYRDRAGQAMADARQTVQEQSRIILDQGKARISGAQAEGEVNTQDDVSAPADNSNAQDGDDGDMPG